MRLEKVQAEAFGPLSGGDLELAPGMNVVFGLNESGKSSWHAALCAALCGMRRGAGLRKEDRLFRDRHRPWDGEVWKVACVVTLSDQRRLELRHDLEDGADCSVTDLTTGQSVTNDLIYEGAPDGATLLGLNRQIAVATFFVRQAEVLAVLENAEQLQEHLQRAATMGGSSETATAERAIRRLEEFRKSAVGTERTRTAPLDKVEQEWGVARATLENARQQHEAYLELVEEYDEAAEEARQSRLRFLGARVAVLKDEVARARSLAEGLPEKLPELSEERETARAVAAAVHSWDQRPPEPQLPEGQTAAELEAEIAGLPDPPEGDTEPAPEVITALRQWENAKERLALHREEPPEKVDAPEGIHASPGELRRYADNLEAEIPEIDAGLEARIEELRGQTQRSARLRMVAAGGAAVAVVGALLIAVDFAIVGAIAASAGVIAAGWGWWASQGVAGDELTRLETRRTVQQETVRQARDRLDQITREVERRGLPVDSSELRAVARRIEEQATAAERRRRWQEREEELSRATEAAAAELRRCLTGRGADGVDDATTDLAEAAQRYQNACKARARQAEQASRRDRLQQQLDARRAAERAAEDDRVQRRKATEAVEAAAQKVGMTNDDPERLVERLRKWMEDHEREVRRSQELRARFHRLEGLLADRSLKDLEEEAERAQAELAAEAPGRHVDIDPGADPGDMLERLRADASKARERESTLRGRLEDRKAALPSVAEAEEEVERLGAEVERLEDLGKTVDQTLEFLTDARERVQRDIAPRLADAVRKHLPLVTNGRYEDVVVDPANLEVKVRDPDGRWRLATRLSHGTAEQIYLLLRLAMTEHLVTTDEPAPVILDDVTVQSDATRTAAFLDLLHELSREHQVILFSQEQEVLEWARQRLRDDDDRLIELRYPSVEVS